jgi:hypothetical protein
MSNSFIVTKNYLFQLRDVVVREPFQLLLFTRTIVRSKIKIKLTKLYFFSMYSRLLSVEKNLSNAVFSCVLYVFYTVYCPTIPMIEENCK